MASPHEPSGQPGKWVHEYRWDGTPIATAPHLSSHVARGQVLIATAYERYRGHLEHVGLTEEFVSVVCHIVESHHSIREWGSPIEPACLEAGIVAAADLVSVRLREMMDALEECGTTEGWAEPQGWRRKPVYYLGRGMRADRAKLTDDDLRRAG